MPSAFVSYAHEDQELVLVLVDHLQAQGLDIRYDGVVLQIGDSLIRAISQEIEEGDFLIAIVSPDSVESEWCQKELALAMTPRASTTAESRCCRSDSVEPRCRQCSRTLTGAMPISTMSKRSRGVVRLRFERTLKVERLTLHAKPKKPRKLRETQLTKKWSVTFALRKSRR